MSLKSEYSAGQRIVALDEDDEPTTTVGTVVNNSEVKDLKKVVVELDNLESPRIADIDNIDTIGCTTCDQTGIIAENREGTVYPTACPDCFNDGKKLGYIWDANDYQITSPV